MFLYRNDTESSDGSSWLGSERGKLDKSLEDLHRVSSNSPSHGPSKGSKIFTNRSVPRRSPVNTVTGQQSLVNSHWSTQSLVNSHWSTQSLVNTVTGQQSLVNSHWSTVTGQQSHWSTVNGQQSLVNSHWSTQSLVHVPGQVCPRK